MAFYPLWQKCQLSTFNRLPVEIRKHVLEPGMVLQDRGHELTPRPKCGSPKLFWEETARDMASAAEDWSDWDPSTADGLDAIPWDHPAKAIPKPGPLEVSCVVPETFPRYHFKLV